MDKQEIIDVDCIDIQDVIDVSLLQKFQDDFAVRMKVASIIVGRDGRPVTKPSGYSVFCRDFIRKNMLGSSRCAECDRRGGEEAARTGRPCIYKCHAGLIDFALPIMIKDKLVGSILGGQVLLEKPKECEYVKIAEELNIDKTKLFEALRKVNIISNEEIVAAAEILSLVANALSEIGYEKLELKKTSKRLEKEIFDKNMLLQENIKHSHFKTQLLSTIAHELNTPLNIIYSSLQLINNTKEKFSIIETFRVFMKYSNIIYQNCKRLIRMINNIIDANKITGEFNCVKYENINIVKFIEDITMSIIKYSKLKNIKVIFDTEIEEKIIAFDYIKIQKVILNLLSNSVKYTGRGGFIKVNIYEDNPYISISVKDSGQGISKEVLENIFTVFSKEDNTFRRKTEGCGLGLYIANSYVKMHNGEVVVKSEPGSGSEFIVKLINQTLNSQLDISKNKETNIHYNTKYTDIEFADIYFD